MNFDESWWGTLGAEIFKQVKAKDDLINELADYCELCAQYPLEMVWSVTLRRKASELAQRAREATR